MLFGAVFIFGANAGYLTLTAMTKYFEEIEDTRQKWKIGYLLVEVIVMTIIAVTAGADNWSKTAMYCKGKVVKHRESIISSTEIQENSLSRLSERGLNGKTQKKSIPVQFCKTQNLLFKMENDYLWQHRINPTFRDRDMKKPLQEAKGRSNV